MHAQDFTLEPAGDEPDAPHEPPVVTDEVPPPAATLEEPTVHAPAEHKPQSEVASQPAAPAADNDPMQLLIAGVNSGVSPERFEQLMTLKERYDAEQARKAFANDMAQFKANPPRVVKDAYNAQYESWYTSIGNLVGSINAELGKAGFTARWDYDQQSNGIYVTCVLTHRMGHSESARLFGPADESGKKNQLQQIKSTTTYLRSATFEAVTGIATNDRSADDDGNSAGAQRGGSGQRNQPGQQTAPAPQGAQRITKEQEMQLIAALDEYDAVSRSGFLIRLRKFTGAKQPPKSIADIPALIFDEAMQIAQGQ